MSKVMILIEDKDDGDEITFQVAVDPPFTEGKTTFTPAEIVGLYLREHFLHILKSAGAWSMEAEQKASEEDDRPLKLIVPDEGERGLV